MPTCLDPRRLWAAYRERMTVRPRLAALGLTLLAVTGLSARAGVPDGGATTSGATASAAPATPSPALTLAAFPMGASTSTTALPADLPQGCRDILTATVLKELEGVPLNADGMGGGIRSDSTRVCVWGEPGAVATRLVTLIGYSPDREARDALYALGNDGYTCYEPHGGIRCEKATAYVRSLGFDDVFHLKGGILKYLEDVPAEQSLWQGECFVFDERVSVSHGLAEGEAELCRACRRPLTPRDRASPAYIEGVSCPHCVEERSDGDRARYAERHRQVELARSRGEAPHIGS